MTDRDMSYDEYRAWQEHDQARGAEERAVDETIRLQGQLADERAEAKRIRDKHEQTARRWYDEAQRATEHATRLQTRLDTVRTIYQDHIAAHRGDIPPHSKCAACRMAEAAGIPTTGSPP